MSKESLKIHVFVDFDGTIVPGDATDRLFQRFADPAWLEIEAKWKAGLIGSRECMARQVDLLRVAPEAFDALVDTVEVDEAFPRFVEICRLHGIEITVVSDGFDRVIASVLARAGLDLPFFANRLEWEGADRWRLAFPNSRSDCRTLSGNCKCQFAAARRERVGIMIGDGRSDFCISERVDVVLAKGALAGHCREMGLPHYPIEGFAEANRLLLTWLEAGLQRRGDGEVHFESAAK